jgi:hypothetical protein
MATYNGTVLSEDGQPLANADVILTSGANSKTAKTDKNGYFNINLDNTTSTGDVSLTFSKSGRTLSTIKNPQLTGEYETPRASINPIIGGTLDLTNGYESGEYLITSLSKADQDQLNVELDNTIEFVKAYPKNYNIIIEAAESKVPNNDREKFLENGSPNPNWAGPEGEFRSEGKLNPKALAQKRSTILKAYIELYFKEQGAPPPTITIADEKIEGPEYPPQDRDGNLYKEGSNEYVRIFNSYKLYQYTRLIVSLSRPTCEWIRNTVASNIDSKAAINIIIPPGTQYLYIDADNFPDRITLNKYTVPYYIQNPNAPGRKDSWGFVVNMVAPSNIPRTPINSGSLKSSLSLDWDEIKTIRENITAFVLDNTKDKTLTTSSLKEALIQEAINIAGSNTVEIKKEIFKYPLGGQVGNVTITALKGNYIGDSIYSFKLCNT